LTLRPRVQRERPVRVGLDVDESRADDAPTSVDDTAGRPDMAGFDRGDTSVTDDDVGDPAGGAAPVDDLSAPDHDIVHTQAPFDDAGRGPPAAPSRAPLRGAGGLGERRRPPAGGPSPRLPA